MALFDNKYWLLSHIRNSFISTDDTGMCEVVMVGESKEVKDKFFSNEPYPDPDQSDEEEDDETGSYDLQMDMVFGMRDRSMTAARLEKLEYNSRKAARMKHIKWESTRSSESKEENKFSNIFVKKDVEAVESRALTDNTLKPTSNASEKNSNNSSTVNMSGLTALIQQFTNLPMNPYMEFAKYDGSGQINIPTRRYKIYLTMLPEEQRNYPLDICCVAIAKIQDLIGLTLLKLSTNHLDFQQKPVSNYGLYITEEDGEVDSDFPNLDPKECVAKFGFTCLGLVEHKEPPKSVSFEPTDEIPSSPDSGGKKRTTSSSKAEESKQIKNDMMLMDGHNKAMEAPLYKSYRVHIVNKLWWWNIEVHLGISSEKIEIDPITQKNPKMQLVKQAPMSHPMDTVAWCEETESKGSKIMFRLVYSSGFNLSDRSNLYSNSFTLSSPLQSSPSFKHYDFEAEKDVAEEIVNKINLILNVRSSQSRRDYLAAKERKHFNKRKPLKYLK